MPDETPNTSVAEPAQQPAAAPFATPSTAPIGSSLSEFRNAATEATRYTIFTVFLLYSIGFVIWHSYLGSYGVSSVAFLQAEYLAAALCYLFILMAFVVPTVLLLANVKRWIARGKSRESNARRGDSMLIILAWFYIVNNVSVVLWSKGDIVASNTVRFMFILGSVAIIHLITAVYLVVRGGWINFLRYAYEQPFKESERVGNWEPSKPYRVIVRLEYISVYAFLFVLLLLCFQPQVDTGFLVSTVCVYIFFLLPLVDTNSVFKLWGTGSALTRSLLGAVVCGMLFLHVQSFGSRQFGKIPRSFGGGKPEVAYLRLSQTHFDVATSLGMFTATNTGAPIGCFGPVCILLRSEKEIIIVDGVDLTSTNAARGSARQIRSDLIDGIVFIQ